MCQYASTERNQLVKPQISAMHIIVDCYDIEPLLEPTVEGLLTRMAIAGNATILKLDTRIFPGGGMTAMALLAESHISVHTWPERDFAAFDIFMCGTSSADKALAYLRSNVSIGNIDVQVIHRGAALTID